MSSSFREPSWPQWLQSYVLDALPSVTSALVFDRRSGAPLGAVGSAAAQCTSAELLRLAALFSAPQRAPRAAPSNLTLSARSAREQLGGSELVLQLAADVRAVAEHSPARVKGEGFVAAACGDAYAALLFTRSAAVDFEVVGLAEKNAALVRSHAPAVPPPPDWAFEVLANSKPTPPPPHGAKNKSSTVVRSEVVAPPTTTTTTTTTTTKSAPVAAAPAAAVTRPCSGCGKAIDLNRESHLKTSVGGFFHVGCLKCASCGIALNGAYAIDDEQRAKCARCQPACAVCSQALRGEYFLLEDNRSVHPHCAPQHVCDGCHAPIEAGETFLQAKGREFHKGCMACEDCKSRIDSFAEIDGPRIVCLPCANSRDHEPAAPDTSASTGVYCHGCRQMIGAGKFVHCLDNKFHVNCLKCRDCQTLLTPQDEIYNKGGEPACAQCGKYKDS